MKKLTSLLFLLLLSYGVQSQESVIKDFAEPRRPTRWMNPVCLYPSTLRMINISQDPQFNELVNDIEKVLIYTLDSATYANKEYKTLLKDYEEIGYEEYIALFGKQEMRIIGKDEEYVGVMAAGGRAMAFYMKGDIPFGKIPTLLQTFQSDDVLPLITDMFK